MYIFRFFIVILIVFICLTEVFSARILGVFPIPSFSHQVVFRALTLELAKRGHELVVITPDPAFKNKTLPKNFKEIDVSDSYELLKIARGRKEVKETFARGVIVDLLHFAGMNRTIVHLANRIYENSAMDEFLNDKSQHFDLILAEGFTFGPLIYTKLFNAPAIIFSSYYATPLSFATVGAISLDPVFSSHQKTKYKNLSLFDKLKQLYDEWIQYKFDYRCERIDNEFLKKKFGPETPSIDELKKNVAMLFVNVHPIFDGNRPVPPGVVYLGALHLQPVKQLPKDLKTYLDNSTRGVIYVSFGTNVIPSEMDKEFLDAFLVAFKTLPYDILWKYDGEKLEGVSDNVRYDKWFPQRDLLGHPNIKVFVSQGGIQSGDEAIDAEVPMVLVPMLGDQWYNANKYVELGIGVEVDSFTMTAEDLVTAVSTVLNNDSYRRNIKQLKKVINDQPTTPLERAVWWTEHVLRHKGGRHLHVFGKHLSWSEYLMVDVLLVLATAFLTLIILGCVLIYVLVKMCLKIGSVKLKQQ